MKKLAVLVSGGGTNMQAIADACISGEIDGEIKLLISSNDTAYAIERAKKLGIPHYVCSLRAHNGDGNARDEAIVALLKEYEIDYVVLAGYLGILTSAFTSAYPYKIINIHPSLLPKFGGKDLYGLKVHTAVINAGESESGATAHFVTLEIDGGPIIRQWKLDVQSDDTPESLQARILDQIEHPMLISVISDVCADKVSVVDNKVVIKK